jgi:asparagine synthase (glutamine-hydrolysing)
MTGAGGDEVLGSNGGRVIRVLHGRVRPRPRDVLTFGYALAPTWVRRRREARRPFPWSPWLTPAAESAVRERVGAAAAPSRMRWDRDERLFARSRTHLLGMANLELIGSLYGMHVASPLGDPVFVDAYAREMGAAGPRSRTAAMHHLAGDLLPKALLERRTKATFNAVVWGPCFREFVMRWSPSDLSADVAELVDVDRLAAAWKEQDPLYTSMMLVQHAWLTSRRGGNGLD